MLTCTKCKSLKEDEEFYNNRTNKRGKTFWCKVCTNHYNNKVNIQSKKLWAARTHQKLKKDNHPKLLWKMAKHRSKEFGLDFNIDVSDIIIPEVCPLLKCKLDSSSKKTLPSLDRIDNSKGYIKGNVRVISFKANQMKSNASQEELMTFARSVLEENAKEGNGCAH